MAPERPMDAGLPAPVYGAPPMPDPPADRDAAVEEDAEVDAEIDSMVNDPPPQPLYGAAPPGREDEEPS